MPKVMQHNIISCIFTTFKLHLYCLLCASNYDYKRHFSFRNTRLTFKDKTCNAFNSSSNLNFQKQGTFGHTVIGSSQQCFWGQCLHSKLCCLQHNTLI